jgi:hypothetical protein
VVAAEPEVSAMYLEQSAMVLLELHRALEADRSRETRFAAQRAAHAEALEQTAEASGRVALVTPDDGAGRSGDSVPDLGRTQDLDPGSGTEHRQRRLVGPVQAHPKS